jgi:hypothetical protein
MFSYIRIGIFVTPFLRWSKSSPAILTIRLSMDNTICADVNALTEFSMHSKHNQKNFGQVWAIGGILSLWLSQWFCIASAKTLAIKALRAPLGFRRAELHFS